MTHPAEPAQRWHPPAPLCTLVLLLAVLLFTGCGSTSYSHWGYDDKTEVKSAELTYLTPVGATCVDCGRKGHTFNGRFSRNGAYRHTGTTQNVEGGSAPDKMPADQGNLTSIREDYSATASWRFTGAHWMGYANLQYGRLPQGRVTQVSLGTGPVFRMGSATLILDAGFSLQNTTIDANTVTTRYSSGCGNPFGFELCNSTITTDTVRKSNQDIRFNPGVSFTTGPIGNLLFTADLRYYGVPDDEELGVDHGVLAFGLRAGYRMSPRFLPYVGVTRFGMGDLSPDGMMVFAGAEF